MNTLQDTVCDIFKYIGEDPNREGLQETPERYKKFLDQWIQRGEKLPFNLTTFSSEGLSQMVAQTNIPFYSLCEHHMLPFFGHASIAYIPKNKIIGLSKLSRVLNFFCNRLQNQERITQQVATCLFEQLNPLGVGVVLRARHLCMEMRGIKTYGSETTTNCLLGVFLYEPDTRNEFLSLSKGK